MTLTIHSRSTNGPIVDCRTILNCIIAACVDAAKNPSIPFADLPTPSATPAWLSGVDMQKRGVIAYFSHGYGHLKKVLNLVKS